MPSLPAYIVPNGLDFSPLENGLARWAQMQDLQQRRAVEQQRLGMEQQRLGFEQGRYEQDMKLAPLRIDIQREQLRQAQLQREQNARMFPLQYDIERQRLAAGGDELAFKRQMHPLEIQMRQKQLEASKFGTVKEGEQLYVQDPTKPGGVRFLEPPGGQSFAKVPEWQAKASGFATRMVSAEDNLRKVIASGAHDPTGVAGAGNRVLEWALPEGAANVVRSEGRQRYMQAAEQWIRAFLRKESGAAIGRDEFVRDFKVYFPQPGDSAEVLAQKEDARRQAMLAFAGEAKGYFKHQSPQQAQMLDDWGRSKTKAQDRQPQPGAGWSIRKLD